MGGRGGGCFIWPLSMSALQKVPRSTFMQASICYFPTRFLKIQLPMAISDCRIHQNALVQAFIQVLALRFHLRKVKKSVRLLVLTRFLFVLSLMIRAQKSCPETEGKAKFTFPFGKLQWAFCSNGSETVFASRLSFHTEIFWNEINTTKNLTVNTKQEEEWRTWLHNLHRYHQQTFFFCHFCKMPKSWRSPENILLKPQIHAGSFSVICLFVWKILRKSGMVRNNTFPNTMI